jgi:hypothetical protein
MGKAVKLRYVPAHPTTLKRINEYLEAAGHREDLDGPLFRPFKNPITGDLDKPLSPAAIYHRIVKLDNGTAYKVQFLLLDPLVLTDVIVLCQSAIERVDRKDGQ